MKLTGCSDCKKVVPLNDTLIIDNVYYCFQCVESKYPNEGELFSHDVRKHYDDTVCNTCKNDFGDEVLKMNSHYPICDSCIVLLREKIFPKWVKAFFAVLVLIILFSFFWNLKYYQAYKEYNQANEFYSHGDFTNASKLALSANSKVPNVKILEFSSSYFHGVDLLYKGVSTEAYNEFYKLQNEYPDDNVVNSLLYYAKAGMAFDSGNYQGFLDASKKSLEMDGASPAILTAIASAYACIYVSKDDEEAKSNCIAYLDSAKAMNDTSAAALAYFNKVEYRLFSKKIISSEEFDKKFPNGWQKTEN